jgi:hypothetical protein
MPEKTPDHIATVNFFDTIPSMAQKSWQFNKLQKGTIIATLKLVV